MSLFDVPPQSSRPMPPLPAPPLFPTGDTRTPVGTQPRSRTQEPMPQWLVKRFTDSGHIDASTGATRRARMSLCPRCRHAVVLGYDGDPSRPHGGYMARQVDPEPLSPTGEILAMLAHRPTFNLSWTGLHWELNGPRDSFQIKAGPRPFVDIVVQHACDGPPLDHQRSKITDPRQRHELPDKPPF